MNRFAILLFCFVAFYSSSNGQIEMHLNISTKWRGEDVANFGNSRNKLRSVGDVGDEYWILTQADLMFRKGFEEVPWFPEVGLYVRKARRERQVLEDRLLLLPQYGTEYLGDLHFVGVKLGGGLRFSWSGGRHALAFPIGIQLYSLTSSFTFPGQGIYFRPMYSIGNMIDPDSSFSISFYAEVDYLIEGATRGGYSTLFGAGVAVGYRFPSSAKARKPSNGLRFL